MLDTHAAPNADENKSATSLETKTGDKSVLDTTAELERFMRNFEAYKAENEQRLAEVERRGSADPLMAEKLARLDRELDENRRRMDEISLKNARAPLGGRETGAATSGAALQHKSAFDGYVRKGDDATLRGLEQKAMAISSDPDGGYLVPQQLEGAINTAMRSLSPMRAIAGIQQVSSATYKRPFATNGVGTGWVGDTAARPQTATPTLAELSYPTMELYAMPAATASLLDDSAVNIDQWLADEVRIAFAQQEGAAFINGDGINKPKGLLAYPQVANSSWAWGSIGTVATGVSGALPASNPSDKLIDLVYAVKSAYRANGSFLMNRATQSVLRKLKDGQGNYIWQPSQTPGEAPSLMGFPVYESEDMPDIAAGSTSIAFGDFKRGYLIVDRVGIRVLRDPYSAKPYVLFYTTKRVGGGVQDFDAVKLLKFA